MRASALAAWLQREFPEEAIIRRWQALEESSALDRFGVNLYNGIQRSMPRAHHVYFNFLEVASLHRRRLRASVQRCFFGLLEDFKPDVIVSVHAHLNHAYFTAAKQYSNGKIRCLTYCGELHGGYGFSRHWVNPAADGFIAAVDECALAAQKLGMSQSRTLRGGFLLQPSFFQPSETPPSRLRQELWGATGEHPIVLLGTGANGANQHMAVLNALAKAGLALTVIALCGRNEVTRQQITAQLNRWPTLRVYPLGYRNDMADILRSVDLAFIRPGTGTTSECMVSACPVLFNGMGGVMPQERITVRFMRGRGCVAEVASSPQACAKRIKQRFVDDWRPRLEQERLLLRSINQGLHPRAILAEVLR
jgi:processive 1,2-diacylglycerol beta-glucosyltransferase